jgi:tripartite-type tricarboxylate transporter receptor subunit TctC
MLQRRSILFGGAAAALGAPASFAQAGPYPARPIHIIVPFGAGGSGDITARMFGKYLEDAWKTSVVVENKAGANGLIGTEWLKNAAPDGYSLAISSGSTHAAAPYLFKKLPYDPLNDFEHVGLFGVLGSVLLVPATSPFKTLQELVGFSKANPGKVFFGHYNTSSQVPGEMLKARAQLPIEGVPYKTVGTAVTDLIAGQVQLMFMDYVAATAHLQGGKVLPIAVSELKRAALLPNVPAVAELFPGYEIMAFLSLSAPAKTPPAIVTRLNRAMRDALATPAFRARMEALGLSLRDYSPPEYRAFLAREIDNWAGYVKIARIEPQ